MSVRDRLREALRETGDVSARNVNQVISLGEGEFNLRDTKNRDAIRKPSGEVRLSDFRGLIYGQGRTPFESQSDGESSVRPYHADFRIESSIPPEKYDMEGVTHQVTEVDGLPQWECYGKRQGFFPGQGVAALDMLGYFVATPGEDIELSFDYYRELEWFGHGDDADFSLYVLSSEDGYLSGARNTDVDEFRIEQTNEWESKVVEFRPAYPHVTFVFASKYITGWKVGQRVKLRNIEVTPI